MGATWIESLTMLLSKGASMHDSDKTTTYQLRIFKAFYSTMEE